MRARFRTPALIFICLCLLLQPIRAQVPSRPASAASPPQHFEYLWYEAENMSGITVDARGEPRTNPSWMELTRAQAPGFALNGPGVSAEWSQGGESEWDSVATAADETRAAVYQEIEVPRDGEYRVRSEEHTSELQSRVDLVCRLLLEKKKKKAWRRPGADSSSAGTVDAVCENQNEITKKQLDSPKNIEEMQADTINEHA